MHTVLPKKVLTERRADKAAIRVSPIVLETAALEPAAVFTRLSTRADGLTSARGRRAPRGARPERPRP